MKRVAMISVLICWLAGAVLAQEPAATEGQATSIAAPQATPSGTALPSTPTAEAKPTRDAPPEPESFEGRVRRLFDDFNQRHQQRELEMATYVKVANSEPGLDRLADPRKVEVELKDEEDREKTSEALAKEYSSEAQKIQRSQQALQDFITKRRQTLDKISQPATDVDRQDLEVAAANLARQPGTEAQVREINRRLSEATRDQKLQAGKQAQAQHEAAGAEEDLAKLQALQESLEKESKAYSADAASAHDNRLALADRLEFLAVRAQAEDAFDQGKKAVASVQHLAPSPEVIDTLQSPNPRAKSDTKAATAAQSASGGNTVADKPAQVSKE